MQKVQFIKYHPLFAYDVGDKADLLEEDASKLIEGKYAVAIGEGELSEEEKLQKLIDEEAKQEGKEKVKVKK